MSNAVGSPNTDTYLRMDTLGRMFVNYHIYEDNTGVNSYSVSRTRDYKWMVYGHFATYTIVLPSFHRSVVPALLVSYEIWM